MPENEVNEPPEIALRDFFVSVPPGSSRVISEDSVRWISPKKEPGKQQGPERQFWLPDIELYCPSERCGGLRWFKAYSSTEKMTVGGGFGDDEEFIGYRCRNCGGTFKTYAVSFDIFSKEGRLVAYKFGEKPAFAPELPPRLQKLLKSDAELFRKGWNAERLGFGIAAVTYYRRVIENHKQQIFDKIIEVAKAENFDPQKIAELEKARDDNSFSPLVRSS